MGGFECVGDGSFTLKLRTELRSSHILIHPHALSSGFSRCVCERWWDWSDKHYSATMRTAQLDNEGYSGGQWYKNGTRFFEGR
jgi:hypothetical protein